MIVIQKLCVAYYICYHFVLQRVHLSIQIGERANDYQEIAAKDKLSDLQLRVRQLLDQVDQISKEQTYQRVSSLLQLYYNRAVTVVSLLPKVSRPFPNRDRFPEQ